MKYYINSISSSREPLDYKELITDANMRRRMSYVVKMGVGTAMNCINSSSVKKIDAILTAMALGCLADSEKFLKNILENDEQLLNPTPFIQSTFNTIGGQIALLTGNHSYNMTYSHRQSSFESALLDGLLLLEDGDAENILVGAADELTPTQTKIMERLGAYRHGVVPAEGANFFIIGTKPTSECVAFIDGFAIDGSRPEGSFDKVIEAGKGYFTSSAEALYDAVKTISGGAKHVLVTNQNFTISIKCC